MSTISTNDMIFGKDVKVECHKYKNAIIDELFISITRESTLGLHLEINLIKATDHYEHNNIIYSLELPNGATMYIHINGDKIDIGNGIRIIE